LLWRYKTVLEAIQEIIHKEFDIDKDKITTDANLRNDLHIDSMAAVNLSFEIEDQFNIKISDEELTNLTTVADIVSLLKSKNVSSKS
jgi:acyl carrier protein